MDKVVTAFYTGVGQEVCRTTRFFPPITYLIEIATATNCSTGPHSNGRTPRCLDEGTGHLGALFLSPVQGTIHFVSYAYTGTSISSVHRPSNSRKAHHDALENAS